MEDEEYDGEQIQTLWRNRKLNKYSRLITIGKNYR